MARPALCIDSDILIDFLRGHGQYAEVFELAVATYRCALPSVAVYEACVGVERFGRRGDWRHLQEVFATLDMLPFDFAAARVSAQVDAILQKKGLRLNFPDLFIAGICISHQTPLLTRNLDHFSRVPQLKVIGPEHLSRTSSI